MHGYGYTLLLRSRFTLIRARFALIRECRTLRFACFARLFRGCFAVVSRVSAVAECNLPRVGAHRVHRAASSHEIAGDPQ
eukprot:3564038-Prymnesium_polylepis.1